MYKKTLGIISVTLLLSACSSGIKSTKVEPLQNKDKNLSCKQLLMEMNEAETYRNMAYKNRGPKLKNILMPLGYVSTYMNAGDAIDAAEARVSYLDKIYQIFHCQEKDQQDKQTNEMEINQLEMDSDQHSENDPDNEIPYFKSSGSNEPIERHYVDQNGNDSYSRTKYYVK